MPIRTPRRRSWPQALGLSFGIGMAVAALGTMPLMGLPGALAMEFAAPLLRLIAGEGPLYPRDSAWPFALFMTWAGGALLPLAWMATRRWAGVMRGLVFASLWALLAVAAAVAMYWWGLAP